MQGAPVGGVVLVHQGMHRGVAIGVHYWKHRQTTRRTREYRRGCTCCCSDQEPGIGGVEDVENVVHHVWHQSRPAQL